MPKEETTLTNEQLSEKLLYWAKRLANSGGKDWTLCVPANPNHDPDFIMAEAALRLKELSNKGNSESNNNR